MEQQLRNSLVLLRFPFSLFLMPTFFFAWSQCREVNFPNLILVFIIMHLLVYPASNGYNSFMDRDEGSIGGIEKPPPPPVKLFYMTIVMDMTALLLSALVNYYFTAGILIYIACSRAYSYRGIRLKKYPVAGFLTVFLVQGAITFYTIYKGIAASVNEQPPLVCMLASSMLIGALYPLTQIYQHEQDKADGVISISYKLGYRGTFLFSGLLFIAATVLMFIYFKNHNHLYSFYVFILALLPAVAYFFYWAIKVFKNFEAANFRSSLWMNIIASLCTNTAFILLTILKQ
jgi:1,4-dihydroxy-2-naphthoate octaprenyltransferase